MKKATIISVTTIGEVLTEKAQKKITEQENQVIKEPRDEHGRTANWYREAALPVPDDLEIEDSRYWKNFDREDLGYEPNDEDYEDVYGEGIFELDQFKCAVGTEGNGCTIFLRDGLTLTVVEEVYEVYSIIHWETRGVLKRITDYIYFNIIKKITNKKQIKYLNT